MTPDEIIAFPDALQAAVARKKYRVTHFVMGSCPLTDEPEAKISIYVPGVGEWSMFMSIKRMNADPQDYTVTRVIHLLEDSISEKRRQDDSRRV